MPGSHLSALVAILRSNPELLDKLKGVDDLDAAAVLFNEAGLDVCKGDLLKFKSDKLRDLSDEDLEFLAGGGKVDRFYDEITDSVT